MGESYEMDAAVTTAELLRAGTRRLTPSSESAALDAELLLAHALGAHRARLKSHPEIAPAPSARALYCALIERRVAGTPLAYLVGYKDFWSLRLEVGPEVLVPRPETELLVERALSLWPGVSGTALDLGTGSGAIALALASERPHGRITATDASEAALAVARRNAVALRLEVEWLAGDWFAPLGARRFHLVLSNPPYVAADDAVLRGPPLDHEPIAALTPGADALASLSAIILSAPEHLERGGWLALEHGATQGAQVARALVARGFRHVRSHRDLAGEERVTEGQLL
jgi:release factor glutamine methyltransferase